MPCARWSWRNPVVGCNGVEYSNPCVAQVSGVTSWTNAATGLTNTLDWNCEYW